MKNKKLKIAVAATVKTAFPLKGMPNLFFAPLKIALNTAQGLAKRGHEITFFGPKGSSSKIFKTFTVPIPAVYKDEKLLKMEGVPEPELKIKDKEKMLVLLEQYFFSFVFWECQKNNFDIIHIHAPNEAMPLVFFSKIKTPVAYTIHDAIFPWRKEVFKKFQTKNQYFVSISNFQQKMAPKLNWAGNVYNGIEINLFPFHLKPKNQLAFVGRLTPRKGVAESIKIALKTKENLVIAGSPNRGEFWDKKIKPYLHKKNITYAGFIPYQKIHQYYGSSKALLCPISWDEPFGLTFVEAMACGTPVIAFAGGSVPEIIKDGETGFIVNSSPNDIRGNWIIKKTGIEGLCEAVNRIYAMPEKEYRQMRENCRKHVEKNFTVERMVDEYEKLYYKIIKKRK